MQKYKKSFDYSYALGTELTLELLEYHWQDVISIYVHSKQIDNPIYQKIVSLAQLHHKEIIYSDKIFNILSDKDNCYIIGVFKKFRNDIKKDGNHIVLVNPSNMGNLGTIIRTMVGFGINDLAIIAPGADIFDPKVIRASMRAFFTLRFTYFDSFQQYLDYTSDRNIYPFMLDGAKTIDEVEFKEDFSLVFGNEATGLDSSYHQYGQSVFIKHLNTIDSLNLDNAASIGIYCATKGRVK